MKFSSFLAFPILISSSLALFVGLFFIFFYQFNVQYAEEKSDLLAKAVIQNIQFEIKSRVDVVNSFGVDELIRANSHEEEYAKFCERVIRLFPDIFAVNLVDAKGIIQRVYPFDRNQQAYKQNLNLRPEIKQYLDLSKTERTTVLSHRIKTYQGVVGYTLYVPIYNSTGLHVGWLNVVFNLDDWLRQYLKIHDWQNTRVQIQWDQNPNFLFNAGPESVSLNYEKQFQLLNQNLTFRTGFAPTYLDKRQDLNKKMVIGFGLFLTLFLFYFSFQRAQNEYQLYKANQNLETSYTLISSLTHDIVNPLHSIQIIINKIFDSQAPINQKDKGRLVQLFNSIKEMLEAGKGLQSLRIGKIQLEIAPVNLKQALQSTYLVLEDFLDSKKIKIDDSQVPLNFTVLAEQRSLVYNVLVNVLTNSIKFSPKDETIKIFTEESNSFNFVIIEDNGLGIDEARLKKNNFQSREGTEGEKGYGFGLLQVIYFMKFYSGLFEIENKRTSAGARVTLQFPKS